MDQNDWAFIRSLPGDVKRYVYEVSEIFLHGRPRELERLKEHGSTAERKAAAQELESMGTPGEWFRKEIEKKYPGFTEEQLSILFEHGYRSAL